MGLEYYALNNRTKEMIRPFNGWKAFEILVFIRFEEMFNRTYEFRKECWWMH